MTVHCDREFDGPIAGCGVGVGVLMGGAGAGVLMGVSIDIPSSW